MTNASNSGDAGADLAGLCEKGGELFRVVTREQGGERRAEFADDLRGAVQVFFKSAQPLMIPARHDFRSGAGRVGHVDADGRGLADAVEAADALLEEFGVGGEVVEDEVVGELDVAALDAAAVEEATGDRLRTLERVVAGLAV